MKEMPGPSDPKLFDLKNSEDYLNLITGMTKKKKEMLICLDSKNY